MLGGERVEEPHATGLRLEKGVPSCCWCSANGKLGCWIGCEADWEGFGMSGVVGSELAEGLEFAQVLIFEEMVVIRWRVDRCFYKRLLLYVWV